ncbi:hypothetical protein BRM22_18355 [Xanthomonas oryzae pv. oryzae]|nr:hypothetical protein BRN97_15260 [Xanthomonas oryzae pv. oryzae]RBB18115.1 hypothetical protein BRO13_15840 [Xanthomonas oryzae pv. oryzae]RBB65720.1 hypothetical protein BRN83_02910 [Xanthomonas oryzae pv. oryzae]RBB93612.1 hypothetical protein BRO03_22190 [Xanthomonas oryzae pv. oryzae]RBC08829.1 hypothetical protein BRO02_18160 [Xanthomonas oryzae pv. oryzae]
MPRWPLDWLGLSPEASHTARVAGSHRTNGFRFSNTVELEQLINRLRSPPGGRGRCSESACTTRPPDSCSLRCVSRSYRDVPAACPAMVSGQGPCSQAPDHLLYN